MNRFKRFLSLFLVLVMILSLMPVSAYAEAEEEEPAAVEETVVEESEHEQENSALVSDVQDDPLPEEPVSLEETVAGESEQEQEIPEEQPEAESAAFMMLTSTAPIPIASGKCGDNITWALHEGDALVIEGSGPMWNTRYSDSYPSTIKTVTIGSGVTSVGSSAFFGFNLLESVSLPDTVTSIGDQAFRNCSLLTSITFPSGLKSIGQFAFSGCVALSGDIVLPEGLISIGSCAFYDCWSLTGIMLPASLTSIELPLAAGRSSALTKINVSESSLTYSSIGGVLYSKDGKTLVCCPGAVSGSFTVPENVTDIAECAFYGCSGLTDITIPKSVTSIKIKAFEGCTALKDVRYGGTESDWAQITIGDDNDPLLDADYLFVSGKCGDNLTWVLNENGVLIISGTGAMVDFPEDRPWSDYAEDITSVVLPEGLTTIGAYAFSDFTALEEIILPNGLKEIGDYAFSFCENLTDICLPASLESLGENAFFFCSSLTAITVPSKITAIPQSAFCHCTSLSSVVLPEALTEIGEGAFSACALTVLDLPEGLEVIGESALSNNPFTTIELPDSTQTIGPWAFQGTGLTSITLPDGIVTIEQGTFAACQSLTSVTIPGSVVKIGENAFNSCSNLAAVTFVGTEDEKNQMTVESGNAPLPSAEWTITLAGRGTCGTSLSWTLDNNGVLTISGSGAMDDYTSLDPAPWESFNDSITSVIIGDGVTYIGARAFYGEKTENEQYANLSSVSIGPDVTAIGDHAFYHCMALTSAAMPDNLTEIGSGAFMGCAFESIDLPEGLKTIGNAAFAQCENLISITIPGSVTLIEEQAFAECSSLISVVFEEGITDIPNYCFAGDTALAEVSLPASLTAIGESVFDECGSLKTVRYAGEAEDWENVSVGDGNDVLETAKVLCAGSDFTVEYVLNGGTNSSLNPETYNILDDAVTLTDPTRTGYTFGGWYTDSGFTAQITVIEPETGADLTLYAKWIENKYSIVFMPNGGTGSTAAMSELSYFGSYTLTANAFSRKNYTFTGWNTKADGTGTAYAGNASVNALSESSGSTVTLYAQWTLTPYTITYNLNGGTNNAGNPATYTVQSASISLKNPTRTGYTFKGWYTDKSCKKAVKKTAIAKGSTGNKTFYAKWQVNKYTITYKANGGKGSMAAKKNISYSSNYTLANNKFTRKGYTFVGWNTKADGTGTSYKNKATVSRLSAKNGGKVTLYAQWKVITYTITYKPNGGTTPDNPKTYTVKAATSKFKSPTRTGYTFKGWYSNKSLTKKASNISKGSTGNKTIYAKWEAVKYKITYNLNGGKNNTANPKTYTIANAVTLKSPKKTGYTFAGWYADSAFTVRVTSIPKGSTGAVTLYAKWIKK